MEENVGELRFFGLVDHVGGAGPAFGPVADMRMSSGPSAWKEKPRAGSSSCIEETPMSSTTPSAGAKPASPAMRSSSPKRPSTSVSRPVALLDERGPAAIAVRVAVDAEHARAGRGGQDRRL